jgi:hypothetical protein
MAATYSSRLIFALLLAGATARAKHVIVCGSAQVLEGTLTDRDGKIPCDEHTVPTPSEQRLRDLFAI